eukprot:scaffold17148_cov31-Tisochrysis_lutea.AAC.4
MAVASAFGSPLVLTPFKGCLRCGGAHEQAAAACGHVTQSIWTSSQVPRPPSQPFNCERRMHHTCLPPV